jgi:arylsulfatase A-like enzyme
MVPPASITDPMDNSPYGAYTRVEGYADKALIRYMIAHYYAFVSEVDEWTGRIIDKLEELGLSDNTLVIFTSDHGEMLGAHGMRGKFCFYEESVRVPLILRYPGGIEGGQRIDMPVSTMNLFPTIMEYAGIPGMESDGFSLKGLIEGKTPPYDFAVSEWSRTRENVPNIMIRTRRWKLMTTHRAGGPDVDALYNLEEDPHEMNNLLGSNPDSMLYGEIVKDLHRKLSSYLNDIDYPLAKEIAGREILLR